MFNTHAHTMQDDAQIANAMHEHAQKCKAARANAKHYANSVDFFELFEANTFAQELRKNNTWMGFENVNGVTKLTAEYTYDSADSDSGYGWYL